MAKDSTRITAPNVSPKKRTGNNGFDVILKQELQALEGIQTQHPETGAGINTGKSYIKQYTNRIFGAPYQFLDSVDRRFPNVNKNVGNEYLRNIILNSPILHIKPGMPIYTGGSSSEKLANALIGIYGFARNTKKAMDEANMTFGEALITTLSTTTIFKDGAKLQKRMFGFRETYYQYMQHVNYMCRSMATFLNLTENTSNGRFPTGTYIKDNNEFIRFSDMDWEKYRMLSNSKPMKPTEELNDLLNATLIGAGVTIAGKKLKTYKKMVGKSAESMAAATAGLLRGDESVLDQMLGQLGDIVYNGLSEIQETKTKAIDDALETTLGEVLVNKISSVLFMVEPTQFEESLNNETKSSAIETALDTVGTEFASEIAFMTNSNADLGMIDNITELLGDTLTTAGTWLNGITQPVTGGFTANLFNGALKTLKGQKMIYPKIYAKSESSTDYNFKVRLYSPYGDVYNYYMNIIVPLMHLVALAAPRMVTSNAVASPYMVQAFIPGQCTCQLGIIRGMRIIKNPELKHVSVQGFPLDITVEFQIEELYNALSISPANDPASFYYNETLNDYMSNLAGLQPSTDTYTNQRVNAMEQIKDYGEKGLWFQDLVNNAITAGENLLNPFKGR